ncbi:E3 ubiquitin-protein ligase TRIM33-like isoform X1 [Rhopalosiphum maidis]|uniref:E3 ubiquitin-protein ligase TRIM33-like isoform X1 n=2 Tax=Rhopalosiphum maidis TaxID=43146 RepID=UPI000EFFC793|nr:E3 ubiquitin-protein ligase TRIM33-like isoform X1 [Rhopalosiphum maidis]XP_026817743.1 E3 ubiquitin-protein ligase TRIM33-like isoform X1 [Rhopalosiphum maidis]
MMNSDNVNNENVDLWSIDKCIFCKEQIGENSKILNCLHGICENCIPSDETDSNIQCKCGIVTNGELINYPIVLPNVSQAKICCAQYCDVVAKKICMSCNKLYCKPCSTIHLNNNKDHKPILMMTYPLKEEFIACPHCTEKCVEVYCTKCSKMICSLCHLNYHRKHNFKILKKMASQIKLKINMDLIELRKNNNFLNSLMERSDHNIEIFKSQMDQINENIDDATNLLHEEINKRSFELKKSLKDNFIDAVQKINMNKMVLNDFKKENEYYYNLTSSVINNNKTFEFIKISNIVMDQMIIVKRHTTNIPMEIASCYADMVFNYEQSMKECVEKIKGFGNITSTPIVSLPEYKTMMNLNYDHQDLQNNQLPSLSTMTQVKTEILDNEMNIDSDSDSSEYEPLVYCSCCNQWSEKLINCIHCKRSYHYDCHIPSIDQETTPNNPLMKTWKCTLCQDISDIRLHVNVLLKKDVTAYFVSGSSEQRIIQYILMALYCQNGDSEHYRECLDRELYPRYYEIVSDPISLNDIKRRFEYTTSYISFIKLLKDINKVFTNGMFYYTEGDPYHESAKQLQNTFFRMVTLWLPKIDITILQNP